MRLVCFDTETTGLDVQKEYIIQLSLVKFDTETWEKTDTRDWYILPEGPFTIPAEAEAVHHISKDFLLEHGVSLRSVYDDLVAFTEGCDMLSYNGNGYDAPILYYNLKRLGLRFEFEGRVWYDALLLERMHTAGMVDEKGDKLQNNLTSAYTRYYGHPFEGAHNSLDDVLATIEVFKAQVTAHGWAWAQRQEFGFISFDRWLVKRGDYYYLNQGGHKNESLESMLRIDRSYLEWIVDKCQWTDDQTRAIINPYIGRTKAPVCPSQTPAAPKNPSRGKKRCKGHISDADLSLF
jgi:DNA polymerase III epsilon subunit-like protein